MKNQTYFSYFSPFLYWALVKQYHTVNDKECLIDLQKKKKKISPLFTSSHKNLLRHLPANKIALFEAV